MGTLDRPARVAILVGVGSLAGFLLSSLLVGIPASSTVGGMGGMGAGRTAGDMGMMGGMGLAFLPFLLFPLVAVLALGYVGMRALADDDEPADEPTDDSADTPERTDPIARIQRRYTAGELTEAEFERALERELEKESADGMADRSTVEPSETTESR
ncbi:MULTISPECIES: SHOCT domain-containing protein [Haloferacaceae]|uniref:SHOCT domain-containing protein n=1 Tax=Halorubrum glutamatedens TaxID=2707018 RepID=A0ABD5QW71_9EURY|nr:SHOCT domain-containing protein [Halobellus captivus]